MDRAGLEPKWEPGNAVQEFGTSVATQLLEPSLLPLRVHVSKKLEQSARDRWLASGIADWHPNRCPNFSKGLLQRRGLNILNTKQRHKFKVTPM